jgi:putative ABC transport system ATP-binding protein
VLNERPARPCRSPSGARAATARSGFIFQSFNLIGDLTVYENVELPLTYRGMRSAERKERVTAALERVGMAHSRQASAESALRRSAAARRRRPRRVRRAVDPARRRADGNLDSKNGEAVMDLLSELHTAARPSAW